ncbi:MAG: SGT1 protein-domain-containing protein [Linnemannia elongata]|nr:MAG: SGT1 protein-domain-containing protein [Linnemannia elongata]
MDNSFPPRETIQEQRRALAEDTVSYAIYLPSSPSTSASTTTTDPNTQIQDQQQHTTALESAQVARTLISSFVTELSKDYIWHKDAFSLTIASGQGKGSTGQPYLRGQTRFGDSIDDEWVVVHLLREITKRIPGSIARVQDNDGEFLLIEAADQIPAWLDPENSDNRVFIYQGNLHIIPIATTADEKKSFPTTLGSKSRAPKLQDALELIRSTTATTTATGSPQISTLASIKIQQAAFGPLLPDSQEKPFALRKIQEQRHYARCQIPVQIARILETRPEMVTRAAEAFYTRDAVAMAVCSRMTKFLSAPAPAGSAPSTLTICFTKTCYAQLMGQQFQPPKIWDGIVPPPKVEDPQDPQKVREAELGMKLTCGFEILCSEEYPGDFGFRSKDEIQIDSFPFATDDSWRMFKSNLTLRSYFGDERAGSARYQQLEEAAKRQFLEYKADRLNADEGQGEEGVSATFHGHCYHPVQEIERILDVDSAEPVDVKELVDERKSDDDSWMDVDLQDLEDMMRARGFGGGNGGVGSGSMETKEGDRSGLDMQQMLDRFGAFVEDGQGGVEGAEFLDEMSDDDEDDEDDEDTEDDADEDQDMGVKAEVDEAGEEEADGDSDNDMFASDYEEKQAAKRAAKAKRGNKSGGGVFFSVDVEMSEDDEEEDDMDDENLKEYMSALDAELSATKVGESFVKTSAGSRNKEDKGKSGDELDELDEDEVEEMDQEMVDLDLNLAKNLLESFKSQGGLPGPGGNLLSRLGIVLPKDDDDEDDSEEDCA